MSDVFWSVDALVVKDNALFGFGWIFHARQDIVALRLRLRFAGETAAPEDIWADLGKPRDDVGRAFPEQPSAMTSGYVVFGKLPTTARLDSIALECSLADGTTIDLAVPSSSVIRFTHGSDADDNRLALRQFGLFVRRGLRLVRAGRLTSLSEKVRRYLKGRPTNALHRPANLAFLLRQDERDNLCVIVDHDLGGGANHYRERLVESIVQEGRTAIILTFHVATLSHLLIARNSRLNLRFSIPDKSFFLDAVRSLAVSDIVYNTAVSFAKPDEIPQLLMRLKRATSARIKVLIHDFYLVCPSHFILDQEDKYCDLPDPCVCANCLPRNRQGFAALFREGDVTKWRAIWGALLADTDEIVAFSNSSAQILLKAYPWIDPARIAIAPHRVEPLTGGPVRVSDAGRLRIGIVGHIGFHKGAAFIQALAQEIRRRALDLQIVIVGSIDAGCEPSVVSQTGHYRREQLPRLIEASGVNLMLFPSICPETFSYVVQELIDLELPVASFHLGAPAERLADYPKGLVLTSMDPARVLDELIAFHHTMYLAP